MPVLNPFIRALFQSSVLSQALSAQNYVVLVPTTDSLINAQDRESGKRYAELVDDEDFLGSHILRVAQDQNVKENSIRESRGKAKTYSTVNNRSLIIKESMVYSNKGFKSLTQAQILTDQLYHSPASDQQQWLIVFISKPLSGTYEKLSITLPVLSPTSLPESSTASKADRPLQPKKKDIQTFSELLNHFPMIARQMQPGLERLFNEFGKELGKPLPLPPSRSPTIVSLAGTTQASDSSETGSIKSNGSLKLPFNSTAFFEDEEDLMRRALETAVTTAIDLFQGVDKQQLSLLGATTDLTGPTVERLIERYVAESVHDNLLFPRLCSFHRAADHDLDRRIRQMDCLDASQVGIAIEETKKAKRDLLSRIDNGVEVFRKMGVAGSPQQMLDVLLETQKVVSQPQGITDEEKRATAMTINADVLVSLLLIVVIRSGVRHLQARLSYMQRFIYIDDVESGEMGYALSTLEAVLAYLATDAGGLRRASKQNLALWNAVKSGHVPEIKSIFEGSSTAVVVEEPGDMDGGKSRPPLSRSSTKSNLSVEFLPDAADGVSNSANGNLAHVFPFQASDAPAPKRKKRVKMDARSMSISSSMSIISRTATLESTLSGIEGDTSVRSLAQTQDRAGNSILMMAIEARKPKSLRYLLDLEEHYPPEVVLDDVTSERTTLLSAAIQLSDTELVEIILDYVEHHTDLVSLREYVAKQDSRGRCSAHYLFNIPTLINRLADRLPWRLKDRIGHTPLFAICRSYDHNNYTTMVSEALMAAKNAQGDGKALSLEDHTDNRGNTLLHILNDPMILHRVLHQCDANPNSMNDKKFTPLMLASKYGRVDIVRIFFGDPRIDLYLREARGLTAVELAKDDEVRNRIDDLTLFSDSATAQAPDATGRITSIVRSFFVEDGTTRYIIKSGAPHNEVSNNTYTITTSRRSLQDFSNLIKWLSADHPASYMPALKPSSLRSPFQIHSKPSKAVLLDAQIQLDRFLKILMTHPTFSTHEVLWEFFLVPDMQPDQIEARSRLKADVLQERIADDYDPLTSRQELTDIDSVVSHSRDMVRRLNVNTRAIVRKGRVYHQATSDMAESLILLSNVVSTLGPPSTTLPRPHTEALSKLAGLIHTEPPSSPLVTYVSAMASFQTTIAAMQTVLTRPSSLANQIRTAQKALDRAHSHLASNAAPRKGPFNIALPGMEESRLRSLRDTEKSVVEAEGEIEGKGRELRYTQEVVLGELAGWTSWREEWGRNEVRRFAGAMVVRERERLRGMARVLGNLRKAMGKGGGGGM
ncbi:hypothetical protein LTR70_005959 [Exophiala xenobiotica]|uniref:VPS9 domain-containing protein n=1 Tax=Lithohypha guttulata TaxID=1690604 RepID=A0ABR0K8H7_9EURO|nr:hypothetical protein LTR24_006179 [Lithohypha guttulata]KAK5317219.1 hypothetical protein LTR70_005959 [Exophiala xenobiotica]